MINKNGSDFYFSTAEVIPATESDIRRMFDISIESMELQDWEIERIFDINQI